MPADQVRTQDAGLQPDFVSGNAHAPAGHTDHDVVAQAALRPNRVVLVGKRPGHRGPLHRLLTRGQIPLKTLERWRGLRLGFVVEKNVDVFLRGIVPKYSPSVLIAVFEEEGVLVDAPGGLRGAPGEDHPVHVVAKQPVHLQGVLVGTFNELRVRIGAVPQGRGLTPLLDTEAHIGFPSHQAGRDLC